MIQIQLQWPNNLISNDSTLLQTGQGLDVRRIARNNGLVTEVSNNLARPLLDTAPDFNDAVANETVERVTLELNQASQPDGNPGESGEPSGGSETTFFENNLIPPQGSVVEEPATTVAEDNQAGSTEVNDPAPAADQAPENNEGPADNRPNDNGQNAGNDQGNDNNNGNQNNNDNNGGGGNNNAGQGNGGRQSGRG